MIKFIFKDTTIIFLLSLVVSLSVAFERYAFASFVFCFFTWLTICNICGAVMRRKSDEIQ